MSFDFGHVGHASHAEPEVLSVQSSGDGSSDGGFSNPGRTVEAEDLPLSGTTQLAHGDELLQDGKQEIQAQQVLKVLRSLQELTKMRFFTSSIP